jgi:amidophosphoribosyltransferase
VHLRISSPPTTHSCFYGIDTPAREKLLASKLDVEGMAEHIGVDSLAFISMDGLYRAMGEEQRVKEAPQFCDACFSGDYPTRLQDLDEGTVASQLSLLEEVS